MFRSIRLVIVTAVVMALVACTISPKKILFIGNSLSYYHNGLDYHIEQLASNSKPKVKVEADMFARPYATLSKHWQHDTVHKKIADGGYDVVVLQGDIPETSVEDFLEFTRRFVAEIRNSGAQPVLFMAWASERLGWITIEEIANAHWRISEELDIIVAPAGLAMKQVCEENSEIEMLLGDGEHPSIHGTYLATCVAYATIFNKNPSRSTYLPPSILGTVTEDEGRYLRRIAWEYFQGYRSGTTEDDK